MTNPQYLLLNAKWLEDEMKTVNVNYVNDITAWNVLSKVKNNCRSIFPKEPLVKELRECAIDLGGDLYDRAANEIERLWEENSALASNQCHDGYGDDYGNHRCRVVDEMSAALEKIATDSYGVSGKILNDYKEEFIKEAVKAEREACIEIVCKYSTEWIRNNARIISMTVNAIEKDIRARGDEDKS